MEKLEKIKTSFKKALLDFKTTDLYCKNSADLMFVVTYQAMKSVFSQKSRNITDFNNDFIKYWKEKKQ